MGEGLMSNASATLAPMLGKLQLRKELTSDEQNALLGLPYQLQTIDAGKYIVDEGEDAEHACLLLSGYAYRQKLAVNGARSISALHMTGKIVDLQNSLLGHADHSVRALTHCTIARIPREALIALAQEMPNVGLALWYDTLVDASICREWILNNARRKAQTRLAHFFCEFGMRLEFWGLGDKSNYRLPLTQEQLADVTGMTPVHVNRSLQALEADGLIGRALRSIVVQDWQRLKAAGDFQEAYLHLPATAPKRAETFGP